MILHSLSGGPFATNVYLLEDAAAREALVIDPGGAVAQVLGLLAQRGLRLAAIVNTHGHFDHVSGNRALREATGAPLLIHEADAALAARASGLAAFLRHEAVDSPPPDDFLPDGAVVRAGSIELLAMHTPGHTAGSVSLLCGEMVFCGDLLFAGAPGVTALSGCSVPRLLASIRERIFSLPEGTVIHPGHGPQTTVAAERGLECYRAPAGPAPWPVRHAIGGSRRSGKR